MTGGNEIYGLLVLGGILLGPALLLILVRFIDSKWHVEMVWKRGLRWIYGIWFFTVVGLIVTFVILIRPEEDQGAAFVGILGLLALCFVSGSITYIAREHLLLEYKPKRPLPYSALQIAMSLSISKMLGHGAALLRRRKAPEPPNSWQSSETGPARGSMRSARSQLKGKRLFGA